MTLLYIILAFLAIIAFLYILMLPITIAEVISDIFTILDTGYGNSTSWSYLIMSLILIGIIMVVFYKIFKTIPWFYHYCTIFLMDLAIVIISEAIINYGYEVIDVNRNKIFTIVALIQFIICRISMIIYLRKKSNKDLEEYINESELSKSRKKGV